MNSKDNFREKFLEIMSQSVDNNAAKETPVEPEPIVSEPEVEVAPADNTAQGGKMSDEAIQELLKGRLKEKLQEKSQEEQQQEEPMPISVMPPIEEAIDEPQEEVVEEQKEFQAIETETLQMEELVEELPTEETDEEASPDTTEEVVEAQEEISLEAEEDPVLEESLDASQELPMQMDEAQEVLVQAEEDASNGDMEQMFATELEATIIEREELEEFLEENDLQSNPFSTDTKPAVDLRTLRPPVKTEQALSEVSIITADTVIMGKITTKGHVRVEGEIDGNLKAAGDVKITGKVTGDVDGDNLELLGCDILGNLSATGSAEIGKDVILRGDVVAQTLAISGSIKGNVLGVKSAQMSETAFIEGSLATDELSMSPGAKMNGMVKVGQK